MCGDDVMVVVKKQRATNICGILQEYAWLRRHLLHVGCLWCRWNILFDNTR